jgi:hypothetical protein
MTDYTPSEKVVKELEKVNKVWDNLINNAQDVSTIERVRIILTQVMIEYYLERVAIITEIDTKDEVRKFSFDTLLEKLKEKNLIHTDFEDDLLRLYKIRNIHAHEIEIHDRQIFDLINGVKTIQDPTRFDETERVSKIREILLRGVQRLFMETLVKHEEKL